MSESPNDQKIAAEWIKIIEDPSSAKIREQDIYPRLEKWLNDEDAAQILEIGCGQGICSEIVGVDNRSYVGVDRSPTLINRANQLYKSYNRHFLVGSAEKLNFPDKSFDAVFSVAVWHLLSEPQVASREMSRVLKDNGSFLIITANPGAYKIWTEPYKEIQTEGRHFKGQMKLRDGTLVTETLYLHTQEELLESFLSAGLKIKKTDTFREVGAHQRFLQIEGQKIGSL